MFTHTFERQNCTMCPLQQYSSYIIWRQKLELEKTTVVGMMEWQDVKVGEEYGNTPLQNQFGVKTIGNIWYKDVENVIHTHVNMVTLTRISIP